MSICLVFQRLNHIYGLSYCSTRINNVFSQTTNEIEADYIDIDMPTPPLYCKQIFPKALPI